ncbi:MAG: MarR family transcriptional regulator [Bauldia sp.]|nr:MarR family transcriptional regulator [Bauldia sp.]
MAEALRHPLRPLTLPEAHATVQPRDEAALGLTLAQYAEAKKLPLPFLMDLGLTEIRRAGTTAVRIPYGTVSGEAGPVRFRRSLGGERRFEWAVGARLSLYGLDRLAAAGKEIVLVEGESDCHTLWFHGIPAVGLPGAAMWSESRDAHLLERFEKIFVLIEPDQGGEAMIRWITASVLKDRMLLVSLPAKDPSALHLIDPAEFQAAWHEAKAKATPFSALEQKRRETARTEAWLRCGDLAKTPSILDRFEDDLDDAGVVGERSAAKLLYLAVTSRVLDRPVSMVVKGPSSGGKSYLVDQVLRFFPVEAHYALTAMSEHALVYLDEDLKHRVLVLYEAAGMPSEFGSYAIRSLLSEGRLRYATVDKSVDGELRQRVIEKEGPTGLIATTTLASLHPENETRMISLSVTDTQEQTKSVMRAIAGRKATSPDRRPWHALQTAIAAGPCEVEIPFAMALADLIEPIAVRMRRDFATLLSLIRAHALLHQKSRDTDAAGRIVADIADYAAVRDLYTLVLSQALGAVVSVEIRSTVEAVAATIGGGKQEATVLDVARACHVDKSAASRRVKVAVQAGYLINNQTSRGRPSRLVLGDPLPGDAEILPLPDAVNDEAERLHGCADTGGDDGKGAPGGPPPGERHGSELTWEEVL